MSLHVAGWVECKNPESAWFQDEWAPVINLDPLIDGKQDLHYVSPFLNRWPEDGRLAPGHGLPEDVSAFVVQEANQWMVLNYASWVTWDQLKALKGNESLPDDWRLILAMIEPLAAVCGEENVRVILWEYVTDYGKL